MPHHTEATQCRHSMVQVTVRIPMRDYRALQLLKTKRTNRSDLIRRALMIFLEEEELRALRLQRRVMETAG